MINTTLNKTAPGQLLHDPLVFERNITMHITTLNVLLSAYLILCFQHSSSTAPEGLSRVALYQNKGSKCDFALS